jgi:MYXO-CTERM domain-containing protein
MIRNKARMAIEAAAVAAALLFAPMLSHAQTTDSTTANTSYGNTSTGRHFNWGWLGLLGLLGLWPRGRKEVVTTDTRNTTTASGNRY